MPNLINPALASHWENWLRVFLMVAIGACVVRYSQQYISSKKG